MHEERGQPDLFAPLSAEEKEQLPMSTAHRKHVAALERILVPAPCEPPEAIDIVHRTLGRAAWRWVYRNEAGQPMFAVVRFEKPDGGKDVLPYTFCGTTDEDAEGTPPSDGGWRFLAPAAPRSLYGLNHLAGRPDAPVLICEGEKTVDAASELFPAYVCVTSQGGAKAGHMADWSALGGRDVVIWPDNDPAGRDYADVVGGLVRQKGATAVGIVQIPQEFPRGWDLADPLPNGVPRHNLDEMVAAARDDGEVTLPGGFSLDGNGLYFHPPATKSDAEPEPVFVAAPFTVVGETRNPDGESWGLLLHWSDRDGKHHKWAIPKRLIHRMGNEIAEDLECAGLACGSDAKAHALLKRFVGEVKASKCLTCVSRTGWHQIGEEWVFVLSTDKAFGAGARDVVLQRDHAGADHVFRSAGTLTSWQESVAKLAVGNGLAALCCSAAFAGPLLDLLGEASGGMHIVGDSRTGKTTVAQMAASVWGPPTSDGQMRQWRGTANGLEAAAVETSDTLLILDEMSQSSAAEVGEVVYMMSNGSGKQRATRSGGARRRQTWRVLLLSTGELTLADKMGEAGRQTTAGQDVRLINLRADAGSGMGVFQELHGRASAGELVEEIQERVRANHGTAALAFLEKLVAERNDPEFGLRRHLEALRRTFLTNNVPAGADGQVRSVASRFALVAAAGSLATRYGVLPWPEGEAERAAAECFSWWLVERGGIGAMEERTALEQVRYFLEAHQFSRFTEVVRSISGSLTEEVRPDARTIMRAGYRRKIDGEVDGWEFLVLPVTWNRDLCKGFDAKRVARILADKGYLVREKSGSYSCSMTIPGEGKRRVYRIRGTILEGDHGPRVDS